eukprot:Gb_35048 [translate_table: standard]
MCESSYDQVAVCVAATFPTSQKPSPPPGFPPENCHPGRGEKPLAFLEAPASYYITRPNTDVGLPSLLYCRRIEEGSGKGESNEWNCGRQRRGIEEMGRVGLREFGVGKFVQGRIKSCFRQPVEEEGGGGEEEEVSSGQFAYKRGYLCRLQGLLSVVPALIIRTDTHPHILFKMESTSLNTNKQDRGVDDAHLPPGFRFHPTDEELVTYYLTQKVVDSGFTCRAIAEVDLNKCEPWDLPEKAKMGEKEWYFFSLRDRKYPTGLRTNRATEAGYWKATGKDREIFRGRTTTLVGMKKTLVFYKGRAPKGEKSNWVMHEYRLEGKFSHYNLPKTAKDEWVVTRIFQKTSGAKKNNSLGCNRTSYLNDLDSAALPPLLESPYITTNEVKEGSRSLESESGSARVDQHVSCFSTPMEPFNNKSHGFRTPGTHHMQRDAGSIPADPAELSEFVGLSPYLQNIMLNDPLSNRNMNTSSALSALSNLRQDNNAQFFPQMSIPSYSMSPNVNFSVGSSQSHAGLPSNSILRALVDQYTGIHDSSNKQCKMEPSSSSFADKFGNDKTLRVLDQWVNGNQQQNQHQINLQGKYGVSQQIQTQPMVSISQETGLSTDINTEISSVVSNSLNPPYNNNNEEAPSSVDLDCLWTY